jgi:heme A synthase
MQQSAKKAPAAGKGILRISLLLFLLFFVNLLIGKGNIIFNWGIPHLGSLAEFLLLGAASTTLIWAALKREVAEKDVNNITSKEA